MKKQIKKLLCIALVVGIFVNIFTIQLFAVVKEELCVYNRPDGSTIEYYIDGDGNTYVYENGEKTPVAIPVRTEVLSNEEFSKLESSMTTTRAVDAKSLPYSKTMDVGYGDLTDIIKLDNRSYIYLECSKYRPLLGDKGMSYYIFYSLDGVEWISELFINRTLSSKLKHYVYESGYPYIKIRMWSYDNTVNSCLLEIT